MLCIAASAAVAAPKSHSGSVKCGNLQVHTWGAGNERSGLRAERLHRANSRAADAASSGLRPHPVDAFAGVHDTAPPCRRRAPCGTTGPVLSVSSGAPQAAGAPQAFSGAPQASCSGALPCLRRRRRRDGPGAGARTRLLDGVPPESVPQPLQDVLDRRVRRPLGGPGHDGQLLVLRADSAAGQTECASVSLPTGARVSLGPGKSSCHT